MAEFVVGSLRLSMRRLAASLLPIAISLSVLTAGCGGSSSSSSTPSNQGVPADIKAIFNKPLYQGATWGLRVMNGDKVLIDFTPEKRFQIGSVRKIFSVSDLLDTVGPTHTYDTPIYRQGEVSGGVLNGDLILVASGDLTMGGRTNPDGSIAITDDDHNEADSLGNAILTTPDPLAGYKSLAQQVAAAGITQITGEIAIDDRLFQPYNFRGQFQLRPIFVNDDVVDMTINPTTPGSAASLVWRPLSAGFAVNNLIETGAAGTTYSVQFNEEPDCFGTPGCTGTVTGTLPIDYEVPLTDSFPLVQTFRIVEPSDYARTILIEALQAAGVTVNAPVVEHNPVGILPAKNSYSPGAQVAQLTGMPYSDDAKLILKVSYNIGADTSMLLFGLQHGVDNMADALNVEKEYLAHTYGIEPDEYQFPDGSGGGDTIAFTRTVTRLLNDMTASPNFGVFFDSLPALGVDGSLAFVTDFQSDPTLTGATGQVSAKTGTFLQLVSGKLVVKGQAFGGYVQAKSGKRLSYMLVVNDVPVGGLPDVIQVFQDEGTISAMLWRDN